MSGAYRLIDRIEQGYEDNTVRLALQERLDVKPAPYYLVSWRTRYPSGRSNRRFYRTNADGCWTIPLDVARSLLSRAHARKFLKTKYDDQYIRFGGGPASFISSETASEVEKCSLREEIMLTEGESDWGNNPKFCVGVEYGGSWRKIMIVDSKQEEVTFCSTTTDTSYRPAIRIGEGVKWRMDNAMQDASTQIMREFLAFLGRFK